MLVERLNNACVPTMAINTERINNGIMFQRILNNKSNSRPPKLEVTGILVPCKKLIGGYWCRFKLVTDSIEYFLRIRGGLVQAAKTAAWEEVTVKGYLDLESDLFDVERIVLVEKDFSQGMSTTVGDRGADLSLFKKAINQFGWIEPAIDGLAS